MRMVLEEIEDNVAFLIPDEGSNAKYIKAKELPKDSEVGDVLEVIFAEKNVIHSIKRVEGEKEKRLKKNRQKRKHLLERNKR